MGLDNMPMVYPCKKENIAIMTDDGRIDCKSTIAANQCPYHREINKNVLVRDISPVYGMIGTNCWYRGKYGNYLLQTMQDFNSLFPYDMNGFYGDIDESEESQGGISEDECLNMAEAMIQFSESWVHYVNTKSNAENEAEREALINDWLYAGWWLKFVGNYGEGSGVWY